jgi:hypothetical protein
MAVMAAAPFQRGLRFRSINQPGDPVLSECTFLCQDLWANGYRKVIMDPKVGGGLSVRLPMSEQAVTACPPPL